MKGRKFTEDEIRSIMAQLLLAIDLTHRKGIVHRDIKPDNILITDIKDMSVCITDLGMACRLDDH
jgi:serine/threonine protein kinase